MDRMKKINRWIGLVLLLGGLATHVGAVTIDLDVNDISAEYVPGGTQSSPGSGLTFSWSTTPLLSADFSIDKTMVLNLHAPTGLAFIFTEVPDFTAGGYFSVDMQVSDYSPGLPIESVPGSVSFLGTTGTAPGTSTGSATMDYVSLLFDFTAGVLSSNFTAETISITCDIPAEFNTAYTDAGITILAQWFLSAEVGSNAPNPGTWGTIGAVPEPATTGLLVLSGLGLYGFRRFKKYYGLS